MTPYTDDLFRKVIEQRKLNKHDKALYYWLKIHANTTYGFFVELIPQLQSKVASVEVFSGERNCSDRSDVLEKEGPWFFAPLASLITAAGRLLLAMTEACVTEMQATYLFCDTDSLAIVASKTGGRLRLPGSDGKRILTRDEVRIIVDGFASLNPYDREIVKGSILNVVDANYVDSDLSKQRRQLYGYSIAAKAAEYGRITKVVASEDVKNEIRIIGINKCARESGFDRKNFIRKLMRGIAVKRNSYNRFLRWLQAFRLQNEI